MSEVNDLAYRWSDIILLYSKAFYSSITILGEGISQPSQEKTPLEKSAPPPLIKIFSFLKT